MIEELCKAVSEEYGSDSMAPGVLTSWLENQEKWYVSIQRFKGKEKTVVFKASAKILDDAYRMVAKDFLKVAKDKSAIAILTEKVL